MVAGGNDAVMAEAFFLHGEELILQIFYFDYAAGAEECGFDFILGDNALFDVVVYFAVFGACAREGVNAGLDVADIQAPGAVVE